MRSTLFVCLALFGFSLLLRLAFWDRFPPGFTADEAVMGYDAYSLLKTGKDQFGNSWPLAFRSFGDWRPPAAVWTMIPFILAYGLTPLAVRFPSMVSGSLTVVLTYLVGRKLVSHRSGLFGAVLLAISPWSLLHTRFAQEANIATLAITAGIGALVLWWQEKRRYPYIISVAILFSLALYAYHNMRLTVPILAVSAAVFFWRELKSQKKQLVVGFFFFVLATLPLFAWLLRFPQAAIRRPASQSVFSDQGIKIALINDIAAQGPNAPIWLTRVFHNKPLYYGKAILSGYLSHFDPRFLFVSGDPHERFRTPGSGLLPWSLVVFIPVGALVYLRGARSRRLILFWLFLSPLVASLSTIVPNSQHAQDMIVPLHLVAGAGAAAIAGKRSIILWGAVTTATALSFARFLIGYTQVIPADTRYLQAWHYYGNLFEKLRPYYGQRIVFLGGQYYINLAFFLRYDPTQFQREVRVTTPENLSEFDHVSAFAFYEFRRTRDIPSELETGVVYVRLNEAGESLPDNITVIDREVWPDEQRDYRVFRLTTDNY